MDSVTTSTRSKAWEQHHPSSQPLPRFSGGAGRKHAHIGSGVLQLLNRVNRPVAITAFGRRRISLEHPLVCPRTSGLSVVSFGSGQLGLDDVDVAFVVRADLVAWRMR